VGGDSGHRGGSGQDLIITTTPILNIDKLPDYQYAGLPLGIYTNYYGKGCQRSNRGTFNKNCKKPQHQRVDFQGIFP